jgi:cell division protein FtsZ
MSIKLQLPKLTDLKPKLTVIGVGGAGCNAINNMIAAGLTGVDFVVANTDAQALSASSAEYRIQLGVNLTEGLGAGAKPEIGEAAAQEALDEIRSQISGSHMVFIAAGMGGGTGTGAASVIARCARELGILVVAIVTKPFLFEGSRRMRTAEAGVNDLKNYVDTLIVIPNQNLFRIANEKTTFAEAFMLADQVLYSGVACIIDLIIKEGLINLDFADVRAVMSGMGAAMMGTGEASGERRAIEAAEEAIANPLLDDVSLKGAKGLLLSITGGNDLTLYEVDEAASRVREEVDPEANIIVGATFDDTLGDRVRVSIVASGMTRMDEAAQTAAAPSGLNKETWVPQPDQNARSPRGQGQQWEDPDVQRRISEALHYGGDAGHPAQQGGREAAGPRNEPPRDMWHGPGDVTVEEGLPNMGHASHHAMPGHDFNQPHGGQSTFEPAPPVDVRRQGRRMPSVEDFPVVGQREYFAKTGQGRAPDAHTQPRRRGLFERLTGIGRRQNDSFGEPASRPVTKPAERTAGGPPARGRGHNPAGGGRDQAPPAQSQEDVDLPVFFNRERK